MFFPIWLKSPLMDEAGEGAGGGAGAGAGEGSGGAGAGAGAGGGTAITLEAITQLLDSRVNGLATRFEKRFEKIEKPPAAGGADGKGKEGDGKGTGGEQLTESQKIAARESEELRTRVNTLEEERKAERAETTRQRLDADVKTALADFTWDKETDGKEVALDFYKGKAKQDDTGVWMIGDVPMAKYIKDDVARRFKGMLAARAVGGAGADKNAGGSGGKKVDLADIRPGMSKDTESAAVSEIKSALAQAQLESGV